MRILLALITVFAVFQAQAYCYITGTDKTPIRKANPVEINLDTANSNQEIPITFISGTPEFKCYANFLSGNTFSLSTLANGKEQFYSIKNNIHNVVIGISLVSTKSSTSNFTGESSSGGKAYAATHIDDQLQYKLKYSLKFNHAGSVNNILDVNQAVILEDKLILKPSSCSFIGCIYGNNNTGQQYVNEVPIVVKYTPTTCTFKNQAISAPDISYHEIDSNGFAVPKSQQPELQCSSITGVATSNIHYHFESISATQGNILKNDLETLQGSAGEVGFQLMNNNKAINFPSSEQFTLADRGSALLNNTIYPLNLQLRYARYGNKVFAGKVQSKVKVVVDYD